MSSSPTTKPVLLWSHRDAILHRPLALHHFCEERPGADWVPVVIFPLMALDSDNIEGHAAEFISSGIKVNANVIAAREPAHTLKAGRMPHSK
jgi:hypothetical protein